MPTENNSKSVGQSSLKINGIVEAVKFAGLLLRDFDDAFARLTSESSEKLFEAHYPNRQSNLAPVFRINPQKELEIMANKYRLIQQVSLNLAQDQLRKLEKQSSKSRSLANILEPGHNSVALSV